MQALEEELSLAAGSQRSMRSNSFTSADGMSTRSQGSMARQASSNPTQNIGTSPSCNLFLRLPVQVHSHPYSRRSAQRWGSCCAVACRMVPV